MKVSEVLNLALVTVAVTAFTFFRCKSIFEEKDQPPQNHVASEQRQNHALGTAEEDFEQHLQKSEEPMGPPAFRFRATQPIQLVISFGGQTKDDEAYDLTILPYGATVRNAYPSSLIGLNSLLKPFHFGGNLKEAPLPCLCQQGSHRCVHVLVSFLPALSHNDAEVATHCPD